MSRTGSAEGRGRVAVVGQGYVGLPLAVALADAGWSVVGYDIDEAKVMDIARGNSPVEDVGTDDLRRVLELGTYSVSSDSEALAGFDAAVVSVPTPLTDGLPDLSHIEQAARVIAPHLRPGCLVVLESTTYPGTTAQLFTPVLEAGSGLKAGADFAVGYSPERIDPGNPTWRLSNTPKIVAGMNLDTRARMVGLYSSAIENIVEVESLEVAELAKLIENTFRHVNIALVNELAMIAHDLDIDIWQALDAAATKPFGFMRFSPGPGVGGHCLPIDPSYLSWQVRQEIGSTFRFVELANDINDHMPAYVVSRVVELLNSASMAVRGSRLLLLGLTYKANTSDARESPALAVVTKLLAMGAEIHVCDPHLPIRHFPCDVRMVTRLDLAEADSGYDGVVLLVDHAEFSDADRIACPWILDTRRFLKGQSVHHL